MANHSFYKTATKDREGQTIFTLKPAKKYAQLLIKNIDDFTTYKSTNTISTNSKKPHQKPLFSSNDILVNHFERERRPDVCVTENYIRNSIPVTIPIVSPKGWKPPLFGTPSF